MPIEFRATTRMEGCQFMGRRFPRAETWITSRCNMAGAVLRLIPLLSGVIAGFGWYARKPA